LNIKLVLSCFLLVSVWAKGDKCMSPFSGDDKLYPGKIKKLTRSPAGDVLALVKFDGYDEDDCEEVDIKNLSTPEKTGRKNESHS